MRRVLVTGAGGFIGHHLVRMLLDGGFDVTCFLRYTSVSSRGLLDHLPDGMADSLRCEFGDIRDRSAVRRAMEGCDTVFHLAALIGIPYSYASPGDVVSVNVGGTLAVLEAAREEGSRVIVTSTSEVYGSAESVPITESHRLNAQSPYAASKTAGDQLALSFHRSFGLPVTICRPFNTYGPGQSQRAVVPSILAQAIFADDVELGSTEPSRDFVYVTDTAAGFVALAGCPAASGRAVQLGTGRETRIGELALMALEAAGRGDARLVYDERRRRPGDSEVERLVASCELARELTGWVPGITLEEGLRLTAGWIRDHPELYRPRGYAV